MFGLLLFLGHAIGGDFFLQLLNFVFEGGSVMVDFLGTVDR